MGADLDSWIAKVRACEYLPENDLKQLCQMVSVYFRPALRRQVPTAGGTCKKFPMRVGNRNQEHPSRRMHSSRRCGDQTSSDVALRYVKAVGLANGKTKEGR